MRIYDLAIKRPVTIIMCVVMILILGFVSLSGIGIDMLPNISFPMVMVMTSYEGAGPQEVENLITKPLEEVLSTVSNFKSVSSTSSLGSSMINIEFTQGTDMKFASLNIREKIDLIKNALPDGAGDPVVMQLDSSMMPVSQYGISGEYDMSEIKSIVDDKVKSRLERIDGVASVSVSGGLTRQIKVSVDPQKLEANGLTLAQVSQLLQSENLTMPGGNIEDGGTKYNIRTTSEYETVDQIRKLAITTKTGVIHLDEIAVVEDAFADVESSSTLNGESCVYLVVQKQSEANTVDVSGKVNAELEKIRAEMNDLHIQLVYDQADYIKMSVNSVANSAILGGVLAVLILLLFLRDWKTTLIIAVSMPFSIVATFIMIYFADITINMMSLGGLTLGVGMLVDNSIVVLESIFRHREMESDPKAAASKGTKEVAMAITASTLTTIAVFLPIAFVKDNMVISMFRELALTVTFSLVSSLIIALTLVPMLASKMPLTEKKSSFTDDTSTKSLFGKFRNWYKSVLVYSIRHRKTVFLTIAGVLVVTIVLGSAFLGFEFFPETDEGQVSIDVSLPKGTVLSETQEMTDKVVQEINKFAEEYQPLEFMFVITGGSSGMNFGGSTTNEASIVVSYGPSKERDMSTKELDNILRERLQNIAGAKISVTESSSMSMSGGDVISVSVKGDDLDTLKEISDQLVDKIKRVKGAVEVKSSLDETMKEIYIKVDKDRANAMNVTSAQVAQAVQYGIMGQTATKFKVDGDEIDVKLRFDELARQNVSDINQIMVQSNAGTYVPLNQVADIQLTDTPMSIVRNDQVRTITITGGASGRNSGEVLADVNKIVESTSLPSGYQFDIGGESENMTEAFSALLMVLLLAIILVYMVMAAQFESLLHPFIILFTMPLAIIGVILLNIFSGMAISVPSFIGFIMLAGIVVNNAIVLVDYINTLRRDGMPLEEAIVNAGITRLRPILMTTLTTVLGLLPLALQIGEGSELQAPMAVTVIGGLIFSTILTLVVIPVIYAMFARSSDKRRERKMRRSERKKLKNESIKIEV